MIQRNAAGLLPVEMEMHAKREPLDMQDMHLALQLSDAYMKQDLFLSQHVLLNRYPDPRPKSSKVNGIFAKPTINGTLPRGDRGVEDAMAMDDGDSNWRGGTKKDADDLMSVLDDCLAVG